jgi:PAS domain S-box-containing protein
MNILIVEDNADDRRLLRYTLERHGCTVIEARDGEEGLDLAMRHKPDIIVSDALMPRMDGFQFLRVLKTDPDLRSVPFLFYSATYTGEKEEKLALSLGAEAFVIKPKEPKELWEKICAIMKAWEERQVTPAHPEPVENEEKYLREYDRVVATKLGKKVRELEEALEFRKQAEDELRRLNADLISEIGKRWNTEEQITKLGSLKERLIETISLNEKLRITTDGVVDIFGSDFARIWLIREGDLCENGCIHAQTVEGPDVCRDRVRCLHLLASSGRYTHIDGIHRRVPFGCYKIGRIASGVYNRFLTNDVANDPQVHDHEWAKSLGLVSFAGFKLLSPYGEPIGVLALFSRQPILPIEEGLMMNLAEFLSLVILSDKDRETLRESERRFLLFMGHFPGLAYIKDYECRTVFANRGFLIQLGIDPAEIIGKTNQDILPAEFAERVTADDRRVLDSEVSEEYAEYEEEVAGRTWLTRKFAIPVTDNQPLLGGITFDITERKRAEEEKAKIDAQNRQLQKAESLGRMAGAIAHRFNNQLTSVMGNLELAMIRLPMDAVPMRNLRRAMQSAHEAAEVSGLMLTYLGQTTGEHEPLDLAEACRRSLPMLRAALSKELVLESDLPSPGPIISANANQIQQILINLVTNACEACGNEGGAIRLAVKTVSQTDIPTANRFPIDWRPCGNTYACLEVADSGCGIAEGDIERLFDPFFSTKFTGRGLGLPVILGIIRASGGAVTVESKTGRGSSFRVFLPSSEEELPRKADKKAQGPEIEWGGAILLVEDEEMVRIMAAEMLTLLGYTTLEAENGQEAVELLQRHRDEIRCVLCDLTLPRMDGWKTLAALREISPGVPAILVSDNDEDQVIIGDHPEWPQVFLGKPYRIEGLRDAICRALEEKPGHYQDQTIT